MKNEFEYNEPMNMNEVRQILDGRRLDIPEMFRYAKEQGVRVSDLRMEEKRMFLK